MKPLLCLSGLNSLRLAAALLLALLGLALVGSPSVAAPLDQGTIHKVYISDVRHTSFVVSWTTEQPCTASVVYGTSSVSTTWTLTRIDNVNTTAHYVVLSGLSATTTYYFDTISNGVIDDNSGAHYTVTTGRSIPGNVPPSFGITGTVFLNGGTTPAENVVVYLQIQDAVSGTSQLATSFPAGRTAANGRWSFNLGNLRTANFQDYFAWAMGDTITITAQGGILGTGRIMPSVSGVGNVGDITLNLPATAVTLRSLSSHTESSAWVPVGLALFATSVAIIVVRKHRS
jgi:hypothetical protein